MSWEDLLEFIDSRPDARELQRALTVKLVLEEYTYKEIQNILDVSLGFISKWKTIFDEVGVSGLRLGYKGAPSRLTSEQKEEVITWLKQKNYWNLQELRSHISSEYGVTFNSPTSYYNLFEQAGISWKKSQKKNPRKNQELVDLKKKK